MRDHGFSRLLSAARQGLSIGAEFGAQALEALLWVAESVEESVYEPSSLVHDTDGLHFALLNPPLRMGAFSAVRLQLNGARVDPSRLRLRVGDGSPWRNAAGVTPQAPIALRPGERTEIATDAAPDRPGSLTHLRLELESVAIPPLVWLEIREVPRSAPSR